MMNTLLPGRAMRRRWTAWYRQRGSAAGAVQGQGQIVAGLSRTAAPARSCGCDGAGSPGGPAPLNTRPPTRSPACRALQASRLARCAASTDLKQWLEPKNMLLRWSTATSTGRSRSSRNSLVWALPVRAVTRQSMAANIVAASGNCAPPRNRCRDRGNCFCWARPGCSVPGCAAPGATGLAGKRRAISSSSAA